jgi:hypothetical protein
LLGALVAQGAPTQGSGAKALVRMAKSSLGAASIPVPKAIIVPVTTYFFAATATNDAGQSEYSNEAVFQNSNHVATVTLRWDAVTNADSYTVWKGRQSRTYTNAYPTLATTVVVALGMPRLTNLVVTVTSTNATNLLYSTSLKGPWSLLGATNYVATNPPTRFWRAMGKTKAKSGKAFISGVWQ